MPLIVSSIRSLVVVSLTFLVGCVATDRDVSRDERFLVGYRPGQVYRLARDARMIQVEDATFELIADDSKRDYGKAAGVLSAGTEIRIIGLRHVVIAAPVQWETRVDIDARLVSRPDRIILLNEMSSVVWIDGDQGVKTAVPLPNRAWLELVIAPTHPATASPSADQQS